MSINPQSSVPGTRHFSRFDTLVIAVIIVLVVGIGVTVALGDRVGVTLQRVAPLGMARTTNRITMQFSEAMRRDSVEERFRTEPAMTGAFSWSGNTLIFQPDEAMTPGGNVNVVLASGAVSDSGRMVLSEYQYGFTIQQPRVAYLSPAVTSDTTPINIWIADPADPSAAQQVTFSPSGVYDFAISPDGSQVAFAEDTTAGNNDIKLLNLETGALEQITNCPDSACTTPVWRPDGNMIVYSRVDFNSDMAQQGVGTSPPRLWVLDLTSRPVATRPLFSDLQILGFDAQWSEDGSKIALYDRSSASILIYNFDGGNIIAIESLNGGAGALSPDGTQLVYEEVATAQEGYSFRPYLNLINLASNEQILISDPDEGFSDSAPVWRPDGQMLAFARQDPSFAQNEQIFLYNPNTDEEERMTDDPRYINGFFVWDPTGTQLVIQRFPRSSESMQSPNGGLPEIWTLNVETRELTQVAVNGFIPQWVP